MKALAAAVIAGFLSLFGVHHHEPVLAAASQSASVAVSALPSKFPTESVNNDVVPQHLAVASLPTASDADQSDGIQSSPSSTPRVEYRYIDRYVPIEITATSSADVVTQSQLQSAVDKVTESFNKVINGSAYPAPPTSYQQAGLIGTIALSSKIDQLSGTKLSNVTVDGVSGLTAADIPTDITASNYLPLSGGSLSDALTAPYLVATSSIATSTFAGGILSAGDFTVQQSSGYVGIGMTNPTSFLTVLGSDELWDNAYTANTLTILADRFHHFVPAGKLNGLTLSLDTQANMHSSTQKSAGIYAVSESNFANNVGMALYTRDTTNAPYFTEKIRINSSGNVGLGTTNPSALLTLFKAGSTAANSPQVELIASSTAAGLSPFSYIWSMGVDVSDGGKFKISSSTVIGTNDRFVINGNGNVGIATSSPWRKLAVTGTVGFDGLTAGAGAGALCLSANNEVTYSAGAGCTGSSQRFKHDIASLDASTSLDTILKLNPVSFVYNDDIGVKGPQVGLIAEEVQQVDPRLVATDASGTPFTVKYENFTAILANAIQAIWTTITGFADHFTTKELTFSRATGDELDARKLCLGTTCVTEGQLQALLALAGQSGTAPSASQSTGPSPQAAATSSPPLAPTEPTAPQSLPITNSPPLVPTDSSTSTATSTSQ